MPVRIPAAHLKIVLLVHFLLFSYGKQLYCVSIHLLTKTAWMAWDLSDIGGPYMQSFFITTSSTYTISISPSDRSKNYTCSSLTERTHDVVITLLLRQNYVAISFWRNDNVIICPLNYVLFFCGSEIMICKNISPLSM